MDNVRLKVGKNHNLRELIIQLSDFGYEQTHGFLSSGQFFVSGGMVRIFPVRFASPILIDFFGDQIEGIYNLDDQQLKKIRQLENISILPNVLVLADGIKIFSGDYLVHEDHGVGIFSSTLIRKVGDETIDYAKILYLNNDVLFVPLDQVAAKISKYVGVGRRKPRLNKLGTETWKRTYRKIYEDVIKVARELLQIYASREITNKTPRKINPEWENEVKETFGFIETPDQDNAIKSVYEDLKSDIPMDRLICGDVGFGKTEVALRAAVQTVLNGYQVAFLVPTTILAEQHFATLTKRLQKLPISIARLSRFVSHTEEASTLSGIRNGKADIIVGTHKLLRSQLNFKNLGLLILDEEQKFGVKDKEKLKGIAENVDVLTLSATPIPRTLFMALSGLRDVSLISSIPFGREPVQTEVGAFNDENIRQYIVRETERGGQVYYLHNRVATIEQLRRRLAKDFPDLTIGVAHGQLSEEALAKVMTDFSLGTIDVLVCSTIIENGLDLPNVNTLIVDDADRFGLTQLYQIRGRIGRSNEQAYALFTYSSKRLTNNAVKRLRVIAENTQLGSGYNIAVEDLEIRGGGNILGRQQHGNMETVGLVLYSKLLSEAVTMLKKPGKIL